MYYHCRPLKYVEYGKVFPHKDDENWLLPAYKWLGHYCGYCPQVWLSRCDIGMTGYWCERSLKSRWSSGKKADDILFGFDIIIGFPIDYGFWCGHFLNGVINKPKASVVEINKDIAEWLDVHLADFGKEDREGFAAGKHPLEAAWERFRPDFDAFLKGYVFVERGQVVVPSLNLKVAKKVLCRDERQKKALRRLGFIEDRIVIRNMP